MFNLNNKGFGYIGFFGYILILFGSLFAIVRICNKYDIAVHTSQVFANSDNKYSQQDYYEQYKDSIYLSAIEYFNKYYSGLTNGDYLHISINNLELDEHVLTVCKGYVEINHNYYNPVVKCKN